MKTNNENKKISCDYLLTELQELNKKVELYLQVLTYPDGIYADKPYNAYVGITNNIIDMLSLYDTLHLLCYTEEFSKDYFCFTDTAYRSNLIYLKDRYRKLALREKNDIHINELGLTIRATSVLIKHGIEKLHQLLELKETDLIKMENMGKKATVEVKDMLYKRGLELC